MINPFTGGLDFTSDKQLFESKSNSQTSDVFGRDINEYYNPVDSNLSPEEKLELISSVGEEVIEPEELKLLLKSKKFPNCYDGFEPSGRMHIAQGILRSINVNKLTKAGCKFTFWIADWFALMNNKMGGDLEKIRIVGKYFVEIWRALGMDLRNVKFLWASDEINARPEEYWTMVIDIATKFSYDRILRCTQIMGRSDKDALQISQIMYPCMQCADIFFLEADICQLGNDQRKVNMLAREYCDFSKKKKPIIVSHRMLSGLKQNQTKMSKSDPNSAIFMEDSREEVEMKIKKAFCEEKTVEGNPVMEYAKNIIFASIGYFELKRPEKWGGNIIFKNYEELEKEYLAGNIHPGDLKPSVADHINLLLEPVRQHFEKDPYAKKLLELVRSFRVTR